MHHVFRGRTLSLKLRVFWNALRLSAPRSLATSGECERRAGAYMLVS
jgi:hypothetical protein